MSLPERLSDGPSAAADSKFCGMGGVQLRSAEHSLLIPLLLKLIKRLGGDTKVLKQPLWRSLVVDHDRINFSDTIRLKPRDAGREVEEVAGPHAEAGAVTAALPTGCGR